MGLLVALTVTAWGTMLVLRSLVVGLLVLVVLLAADAAFTGRKTRGPVG